MGRLSFVSTLVVAAGVFWFLSCPTAAYGDSEQEKHIGALVTELNKNLIARWEHDAAIILGLTVAIGVLGVVTAALQKFDNKPCKLVAAVAGIIISVGTLIHQTVRRGENESLSQIPG
jgi:hypothetical protein